MVLRPVTGSCDIKCEILTSCFALNRLKEPYFLNKNLYWSRSVGSAERDLISSESSFRAGRSSSSSSGSLINLLK